VAFPAGERLAVEEGAGLVVGQGNGREQEQQRRDDEPHEFSCGWRSISIKIPTPPTLRLAQERINNPAAAVVRARAWAVGQNVRVVAAGLFEGVGEDGHPVEGAFLVDALSQGKDGGCEPGRGNGCGLEWVAEDVTSQLGLFARSFNPNVLSHLIVV